MPSEVVYQGVTYTEAQMVELWKAIETSIQCYEGRFSAPAIGPYEWHDSPFLALASLAEQLGGEVRNGQE